MAGLQLLELSDDRESDTDLTRRETQVLVWLARGKTLPEAAIILDISLGTAKTHLERAKAKLGASPPCPRCWKPPDAAGSSIQMSLNNVKL